MRAIPKLREALADPECLLYRVVLPYACFGILVKNGTVVYGSGIARWAEGKPIAAVERWLTNNRRGSTLTRLG